MPRPPRIEFENAFYHVMNRGRARQTIYHGDIYYETFLTTVAEACQKFGSIVHAYCLMGNDYHLIIETPNANLSRVMRDINGVYTQRYNRLKKTDGPLFRGRYKAILVDEDSYLLQLSRYAHLNPIEMKRPLVEPLADYRWSSYPAYIGKAARPEWLHCDKIYTMLGHNDPCAGYAAYVAQGVDKDTAAFYKKGKTASLMVTPVLKRGFMMSYCLNFKAPLKVAWCSLTCQSIR
jgi:putative transposase